MTTEFEQTKEVFETVKEAFKLAGTDIHGSRFRLEFARRTIGWMCEFNIISEEEAEDVVSILEYNGGKQLERKKGQSGFTQEDIDTPSIPIINERLSGLEL